MDRLTRGNDNVFRLRLWQRTPEGRIAVDLTQMRDVEVVVKDQMGRKVESDWELDAENANAILLFTSYVNKASCHHTVEITMLTLDKEKHHRFAKRCAFGTVEWGNDADVSFTQYGSTDVADLDIDFEVVTSAITSDKTLIDQLQDMLDTATEQEAERQEAEGNRQTTFEENEAARQAEFDANEAERASQFEGDEDEWDRAIQEKLDEIIAMEFDSVPRNASNKAVKSNGIFDTFAELNEALSDEITGYQLYNYNLQDTGRFGTSASYKHAAIRVYPGEKYLLKRTGINVVRYALATSNSYSSGAYIPVVQGTEVVVLNSDGDEVVIEIPPGCSYLLFNAGSPYGVNLWLYRLKIKPDVIEIASANNLDTEQLAKVREGNCVILYQGKYYYKQSVNTSTNICTFACEPTRRDDVIEMLSLAVNLSSGQVEELASFDPRPRVSANPSTTTSTLSSIKIGSRSYAVQSGYVKPSSGIPKSDLASDVQTSLGKADTAVQTETDPTVPAWAKKSTKPSYNVSEITGAQATLVSGTTIKTVNNQSLLGSGNITIQGGGGASTWDEIEGKPDFATVATSGSYNDLSNKPTIPDVTGKADKVSSATNGHLAGLNASGNLTDSGIVPSTLVYQGASQGTVPSVDFDPMTDTVHVTAQTLSPEQQLQVRTNIGAGTSDFSGSYNDLTNKPTIPDVSAKADKVSNATSGNFAALDNSGNLTDSGHKHSDYLTSHQDISGKEDKLVIETSSSTTLTASLGKYYRFTTAADTFAITLPAVTSSSIGNILFWFTTSDGASQNVTFTANNSEPIYEIDGFAFEASSSYEGNALWNGAAWVISFTKYSVLS